MSHFLLVYPRLPSTIAPSFRVQCLVSQFRVYFKMFFFSKCCGVINEAFFLVNIYSIEFKCGKKTKQQTLSGRPHVTYPSSFTRVYFKYVGFFSRCFPSYYLSTIDKWDRQLTNGISKLVPIPKIFLLHC